ncbi:MAG: flippase-like domain-containing protein [Proteobacteria bacterium]|nr:flippase-like domain-containing protein [Pseudomonadota bacterium]
MKLKVWAGIAISFFFIWLAFRKVDYAELGSVFSRADYRYILPAAAITLFQFFLRAARWGHLVEPIKKVKIASLFSATSIGFMGNNILPARIGEFLRSYAIAKKEDISISASFATIIVERILDTFTLVLFMLYLLYALSLPPEYSDLESTIRKVGGVSALLFFAALTMLFYFKKHKDIFKKILDKIIVPFSQSIAGKVADLVDAFASGLSVVSAGKHLLPISLYSLCVWVLSAVPISLVLLSFGYSYPFAVSVFILVIIAIAVAIPSSPGYIGTFHYACATALGLFNIPEEEALSVAITLHAINFFPITLVGLFYLWKDKLSLPGAGKLEEPL